MIPYCPKQLSGYEYTRESRDPCDEYCTYSTPVNLDFLFYFVSASELVNIKTLLVPNTPRSQDCTVYSLLGSLDALEYLAPGSVAENQFWSIPWCIYHGGSRLPGDEYNGGSCLHAGEYAWESRTNNYTNIRQNSILFLNMPTGSRLSC